MPNADTATETIEITPETVQSLVREMRSLRQEVRSLKGESRRELVRLQEFADELGLARSTIYAKAGRRGIPIRDDAGYPKEEGDKSAAYISRAEWEAAERLNTQTVRRRADFYED